MGQITEEDSAKYVEKSHLSSRSSYTDIALHGAEARSVRTWSQSHFLNEQTQNKWIVDSKMKLNVQKSSVMWFRVSSRKKVVFPDIFVNDVAWRRVDKQKIILVCNV